MLRYFRMSKTETVFSCTHCDAQFTKWAGRCSECGKWGTIQQSSEVVAPAATQKRKELMERVQAATPVSMTDVHVSNVCRLQTQLSEVDRVLGGGIVPGSLILLGGDPGIGKSTLVAQIAAGINASNGTNTSALYVSGEESAPQVKLRFDRMKINQKQIHFLAEEHIEVICKTIVETKPSLVIIDSIQTVASSAVETEAGSVNQIKASTVRLLEVAKQSDIPIIIIGHVTKGGELGGPKTLEHIVDTVLYLEGDRHHYFRLLRATKNRFGATNEIGVFEMQQHGLVGVENPATLFFQERSHVAGTCATAVVEGSRIFLVEVQALVSKTSFGFPQRKSSGFDLNRLNLLLAVLSRRARISFESFDVYVNIVGGSAFKEPAMDLALCVALVSSLRDVAVDPSLIAWGEVGLGGEVRAVSRQNDRAKEAKRFGLTHIISPRMVKHLDEALVNAKLMNGRK